MRINKIYRVLIIIGLLFFLKIDTQADIADPDSFYDAYFGYFSEFQEDDGEGWLQSMCTTDTYIVCLLNSTTEYAPDTLIAFYKNDYDAEGNPVAQYGFAKKICEVDYEHGNGMTYNSDTDEIIIVPGPLTNKSSKGNVYIVDADTLLLKETVKVDEGRQNFSAAGYSEITHQYILQGNRSTGYIFYILDQEFNIVDTIEDYTYTTTIQDICVSGDYILSISYEYDEASDNYINYINVFSISQRKYLTTYQIHLSGEDNRKEMEGICEIAPGYFIVGTALVNPNRIRLDVTQVPGVLRVNTAVQEGEISEGSNQISVGEDYTVNFSTKKHYELTQLLINGEEVESTPDQRSYTFTDIQADYTIEAIFSKIPKFQITTTVENGEITPSKKKYRDKDYAVSYEPSEHYELDKIVIDGAEVDITGIEEEYLFENIQENHSIEVYFKKIPSWTIETSVVNGSITNTITEAYRDTNETVSYEPIEGYMPLYLKIDGKLVSARGHKSSYTFENIQGAHSIEVFFIWRWLPVCIISGTIGIILIVGKAVLTYKRKKRRIHRK